MQRNRLDGMRIAIILSDDLEQAEMTEPRKALEQAGATTVLISPKPGQVTGMNHDIKADTFTVDMTLDQAKPSDFDAVMLPGGALNADFLRMNPQAQKFVKQMDANGKPLAVICHAPWFLVSAGLVKGRTLTSPNFSGLALSQQPLKCEGSHFLARSSNAHTLGALRKNHSSWPATTPESSSSM